MKNVRIGTVAAAVGTCILFGSLAEADNKQPSGPGNCVILPAKSVGVHNPPNHHPRRHGTKFAALDEGTRRASWGHVKGQLPKTGAPTSTTNANGTLVASTTISTGRATGGMTIGAANVVSAQLIGSDNEPSFFYYKTPTTDDFHAPEAYVSIPIGALRPATQYWLDCSVGPYNGNLAGATVTFDVSFAATDPGTTVPMPSNGHLVVGFKSVDAFPTGVNFGMVSISASYPAAGTQMWQFDGCELDAL